ncbi:hypothetical protein J7E93_31285 [Streptomyces sp. ISL-36]|uniref:hypothetical protein n=1 Tax=Streptomyces sp. ISL-36 TaxID=2819182 RepID=UPI001BE4F1DC|nr:hypothetical protein [Streptomyces sp. ISL-36]MBT2444502.1 hypothetical protein [Streptomyces sp. ISL-36]
MDRQIGRRRVSLVIMSPLSADLSSSFRYFLVPMLLLAAAVVIVGHYGGGEEPQPSDDPKPVRAAASAGTGPGTGQQAGPQGGIASRRPSALPAAVTPTPTASVAAAPVPTRADSTSPRSSSPASAAPVRTSPRSGAGGTTAPATGPAVPYQRLRVGECFDIDRAAPGTVVRRDCHRPHDAQLVAIARLTGDYRSDQEVRDRAAELCRVPLRGKAAEQPLGTRWTTFVQYPYRSGYLLGSDAVACSLAAYSGDGAESRGSVAKLTAPLL